MKELSIEEKAKRYDELLTSAKNTIEVNQAIPDIVDCVESLFPELSESEDEKIRKALINQFSDYKRRGENHGFGYSNDRIIAWLEKQGEQRFIKKHDVCDTCEEKASCVIPCPMKLVGQKPTDWSEDDENNINSIVSRLEVDISYWESRSKTRTNEDKKLIEWLKFLKDRCTWKPSDEQITWLYRAADSASKDSRMKQVLNKLLSDLKKLRGE